MVCWHWQAVRQIGLSAQAGNYCQRWTGVRNPGLKSAAIKSVYYPQIPSAGGGVDIPGFMKNRRLYFLYPMIPLRS